MYNSHMNEKILVVEDERDIARMIEYNLKKEGYRTVLVHDGGFAAATVAKEKPARGFQYSLGRCRIPWAGPGWPSAASSIPLILRESVGVRASAVV